MRKLWKLFIVVLTICLLSAPVQGAAPDKRDILGESVVLMDAQTGQVLYEKNAHDVRQPASITKILTGMLALENLDPDTVLTASSTAVSIPSWGSTAYIKAGERLTVRDAMYAMMLKSANEAANILGEAVAGSLDSFAAAMNQRARELGAENTHFTNANGLPERDHVTTAYDMALITRGATQTPGFLAYFGADHYAMPATNRSGVRVFANTHRMLLSSYGVYNKEVIGGKTGYTVPAGYTLVTVAQRGERTLICVVLGSANYYADTQALLDFGFDEFESYTYTFAFRDTQEVPIWDGNRKAGRAYFSPPASASLLLHEDTSPQGITVEYQLPDHLELGEEPQALVEVHVGDSGGEVPGPSVVLPMTAEVATFDPPPELPLDAVAEDRSDDDRSFRHGVVPVLLLAAVSLSICVPSLLRRRQRGKRRDHRSYRI